MFKYKVSLCANAKEKLLLSILPQFLNKTKLASKLALGVVLLAFFSGYQPTLSYPPVKRAIVKAQSEQVQSINSKSLPFSFQLPHPGYISTRFSTWHPGIDIATGLGMPIHPITQGTVIETGFNYWGLGLVVTIDHGEGYRSLYAHLGKTYVKTGQVVSSQDTLGEVGLTGHTSGPHTHLEVSKEGKNVDPLPFLPTLSDVPQAFITPDKKASEQNKEKIDLSFKKELQESL